MQASVGLSTCPKCQAIYHVLKVEGTREAKGEGDLLTDFRTIDKLRDWLPIRREQCAKRVFRKSRWWRSCGRRIASRWPRLPSGTASASRRSTPGASGSGAL